MAANVKDVQLLTVPGFTVAETVAKATGSTRSAHLFYTRTGALPSADGARAAGVSTKAQPAESKALGLATLGYAIVRVKPGAVIPVDAKVSAAATGEAIPTTSTYEVQGYAVDSSDGSGTAGSEHYIVIRLA